MTFCLSVRVKETVIGDSDALEGLDQQSDDVGYERSTTGTTSPCRRLR
jgi:hypothetical protein